MPWILLHVPCPTSDGQTARDLYEKRIQMITPEMQESARSFGCQFHRAWFAEEGLAFYRRPKPDSRTKSGAETISNAWRGEAE